MELWHYIGFGGGKQLQTSGDIFNGGFIVLQSCLGFIVIRHFFIVLDKGEGDEVRVIEGR